MIQLGQEANGAKIKLLMPFEYVTEDSRAEEIMSRWWQKTDKGYCAVVSVPVDGKFLVETMSVLHPAYRGEWKQAYQMLQRFSGISITKSGKYTYVTSPYNPYYVDMFRNLGGKWDAQKKAWKFYNCPSTVEAALLVMEGNSRSRLYADESAFPCDFLSHQLEGAMFFINRWNAGYKGCLLAHDQGLGKTRTSLGFCKLAIDQGQAKRVLFLGTASHQKTVADEWEAVGGSKDEFALLSELDDDDDLTCYTVLVSTPEYLFHKKNRKLFKKIIAMMPNTILVIDEAGRFTKMGNVSYKNMLCLSLPAVFVCALSGTPIINDIQDLEALVQLIDPSIYPHKEFTANHVIKEPMQIFSRGKYAKLLKEGRSQYEARVKSIVTIEKIHTIKHEEFAERVSGFFHRVNKSNIQDLHIQVVPQVITVPLQTNSLEGRMLLKLEAFMQKCKMQMKINKLIEGLSQGGDVRIPKREADVLLRQQQIFDDPLLLFMFAEANEQMSGNEQDDQMKSGLPNLLDFLTQGMKKPLTSEWGEKTRALLEVLYAHEDEKVVIFTQFSTMAKLLVERLKTVFGEEGVMCISGEVSSRRRERILAQFKDDPNARILVGTDAISHAVNLQFVNCLVHYDLPWTAHLLNQRTDRICRLNSLGSQKNIYLFCCEAPFVSVNVESLKREYIVRKAETARLVLGDNACSSVVEEIYFSA